MSYVVYRHVSPSGKSYVGITSQKPEYRWSNGKNYRNSYRFNAAIKKYGWDAFDHYILESGLTKLEAIEREKYYIRLFESDNPHKGYNVSPGGGLLSQEALDSSRQKLKEKVGENSVRGKKIYKISPDGKTIVSEFPTARMAASAEKFSINRIATICRGKNKFAHGYFWCYADDFKPGMFDDKLNIPVTDRGTLSRSGQKNSFYGKKHSEKTIEKIKQTRKRRKVELVETGQKFSSIKEAAMFIGVTPKAIFQAIQNNGTCKNYHWRDFNG